MNLILFKRGPKFDWQKLVVESDDKYGNKLSKAELQERAQQRWGKGELVERGNGWKWEFVK